MTTLRGRVAERLDGDRAGRVIDPIAGKYIGQPYPLRQGRVVILVDAERALANDHRRQDVEGYK